MDHFTTKNLAKFTLRLVPRTPRRPLSQIKCRFRRKIYRNNRRKSEKRKRIKIKVIKGMVNWAMIRIEIVVIEDHARKMTTLI